jgi:hypothetical protein
MDNILELAMFFLDFLGDFGIIPEPRRQGLPFQRFQAILFDG